MVAPEADMFMSVKRKSLLDYVVGREERREGGREGRLYERVTR